MTTAEARAIALDVETKYFGAGASEIQRLASSAVTAIRDLANQLDAVKPPKKDEAIPTTPAPMDPSIGSAASEDDEPAKKRGKK